MKTLKTFLLALVTLFTLSLTAQTTHEFYVDEFEVNQLFEVDVLVGDSVVFYNNLTSTSVVFSVYFDGDTQPIGDSPSGSISSGDMIYGYKFLDQVPELIEVKHSLYNYAVHFTITPTASIGDLSDLNFKVYPNPTADFLNITTSDNIKSVKIFDMNGRVVLSEDYDTSNVRLDVMSLTSGYYTILLNDVKPIRFIKN